MTIRALSLNGLAEYDYTMVARTFDAAIQAAVRDCEDRSKVEKARKVQLTVLLTPTSRDDGTITGVNTVVEISTKTPLFRSGEADCRIGEGHKLTYNDMAPDEHDQGTLDLGKEPPTKGDEA